MVKKNFSKKHKSKGGDENNITDEQWKHCEAMNSIDTPEKNAFNKKMRNKPSEIMKNFINDKNAWIKTCSYETNGNRGYRPLKPDKTRGIPTRMQGEWENTGRFYNYCDVLANNDLSSETFKDESGNDISQEKIYTDNCAEKKKNASWDATKNPVWNKTKAYYDINKRKGEEEPSITCKRLANRKPYIKPEDAIKEYKDNKYDLSYNIFEELKKDKDTWNKTCFYDTNGQRRIEDIKNGPWKEDGHKLHRYCYVFANHDLRGETFKDASGNVISQEQIYTDNCQGTRKDLAPKPKNFHPEWNKTKAYYDINKRKGEEEESSGGKKKASKKRTTKKKKATKKKAVKKNKTAKKKKSGKKK